MFAYKLPNSFTLLVRDAVKLLELLPLQKQI